MKKLKLIILAILLPCVIFLSGCSINDLKNYYGIDPTPLSPSDIEAFTKGDAGKDGKDGKDGLNGINGINGQDGDNINLFEIYEKIQIEDGYTGTYSDFIREFLDKSDTVYASSKALRSTVNIFAGGESTVTYMDFNGVIRSFTHNSYSAGSGVIYSLDKSTGDALIITNYHIVYNAEIEGNIATDINIILYGNEQFSFVTKEAATDYRNYKQYYYQEFTSNYTIKASYLGGSMEYDIAVLKVTNSDVLKNSNAIEAKIADSNLISPGEEAIAVGNASGLGLSVSDGVISKDSEYIQMTGVDGVTDCKFRVLRTSAPINGGNSGGGLFNLNGELVGIVNVKIASSTIENIGYAIPSIVVKYIAENIIKNCNGTTSTQVKKPVFGISIWALKTESVLNPITNAIKIVETIQIASITTGSLADGKLEKGQIIKSVSISRTDGTTTTMNLTRSFNLIDLSLTLSIGDTITFNLQNELYEDIPSVTIEITYESIKVYK